MNTTTVATAVQRRWACHTRKALAADVYGRQRCNVVLSASSVVYVRGCVLDKRGQQKQTKYSRYVRTKEASYKEARKIVLSSPEKKKKKLSARHASSSARIELKPRRQVPDGLLVST